MRTKIAALSMTAAVGLSCLPLAACGSSACAAEGPGLVTVAAGSFSGGGGGARSGGGGSSSVRSGTSGSSGKSGSSSTSRTGGSSSKTGSSSGKSGSGSSKSSRTTTSTGTKGKGGKVSLSKSGSGVKPGPGYNPPKGSRTYSWSRGVRIPPNRPAPHYANVPSGYWAFAGYPGIYPLGVYPPGYLVSSSGC